MSAPTRRRIKKELDALKKYQRDKQFSLAAYGAEWALLWIYHGNKGFAPPTDFIKFGIEGRKRQQWMWP